MTSAVIAQRPATDTTPAIVYRIAGDRAILVEYGEMTFDLSLNFLVLAVDDALRAHPPDGMIETAPGFRSILVSYEPERVSLTKLLGQLDDTHERLSTAGALSVPSRCFQLPIAFDDSQATGAVKRYRRSIRDDAVNCEGDNNIDYVVAYNGLASRDELYEAVLGTDQWSAFIGFFPGLPFLFPLDPRYAVTAPKYNPTRTWTAECAVGLGGPCWAIYPVESAGGYQLVGRTIPIYDLAQRNAAFRDSSMLLRAGDRVRFHRVSEEELLATWDDVHADRYRYEVEDGSLDVAEHLAWTAEVAEEADAARERREAAAAGTPLP